MAIPIAIGIGFNINDKAINAFFTTFKAPLPKNIKVSPIPITVSFNIPPASPMALNGVIKASTKPANIGGSSNLSPPVSAVLSIPNVSDSVAIAALRCVISFSSAIIFSLSATVSSSFFKSFSLSLMISFSLLSVCFI